MNNLVSVIIPVYNGEKRLSLAVDSVRNQTYNNVEIILVNDGSTDGSEELCQEYAKLDNRVKAFSWENRGVSAARNFGIEKSSGEYVTFLDCDDELLPDGIEIMLRQITEYCGDMAIGGLAHSDGAGNDVIEKMNVGKSVLQGNEFLEYALDDNPCAYYSCRILYKKSFLRGLDFEVGRITSEDSYFVFQCALRKPKVVITESVVYRYYNNPTSATRSAFTLKKYNDITYFLLEKEKIISEQYPEYTDRFKNLVLKVHMMLLVNFCNSYGMDWKKYEKESLKVVRKNKKYFVAASKENKIWFLIINCYLYRPYKIFRHLVKKLISR